MLRWERGKTRKDHIRNEESRKEAHIKPVDTFLEKKTLKWFGQCLRRKSNHIITCEIAATRNVWEKEQRSTETEMEEQHKGRYEAIPNERGHGTILKILDY